MQLTVECVCVFVCLPKTCLPMFCFCFSGIGALSLSNLTEIYLNLVGFLFLVLDGEVRALGKHSNPTPKERVYFQK